jgi:DNA repair exonuclease SbcCD nuclease subunit
MIDVLFTDTHFGWKNNSMTWLNSQMNFIYKQFIPTIKKLSKKEPVRVIHLGDVFDSRSTISTYVATKVVEAFKDIRSVCNEFVIVCGNHDFYSPNSDTVNTVTLLLNNIDITIVDQDMYETDNHAFVPWYVYENGEFTTDAKYIFCHADIVNGVIPVGCIGKSVFSGHIHTPLCRNSKGLYNLGSCYSLNFADANSTRGFYVIENDKVQFIPNKESINFYRFYNDEILNKDIDSLNTNDYIEIYVSEINMSKDDYITAIKKFTDRFTHLWIIPQVVSSASATGEDFKEYDIEAIMADMIPDDLQHFFEKVKNRLNN